MNQHEHMWNSKSYLNLLKSSRLFLHLGLGIVLLALACLPAKARVVYGVDLDIIYMGPIFTLLIGIWSFPSLLLGTIESSTSEKTVLLRFTSILFIANIALALMVSQQVRFPYSDIMPFLAPCIVTDIIALCHFITGQKIATILKNLRIRVLLIITLAAFPILVIAGNLAQGAIFY